jgi:hypothetical protein
MSKHIRLDAVAAVFGTGLILGYPVPLNLAHAQEAPSFANPELRKPLQDPKDADARRQERLERLRILLKIRFDDPRLSDLEAGRSSLGSSASKVPGNYGPNAYPIPPLDDPRVGDDIIIRNGAGFQLDRGSDRSFTWDAGVSIPFHRTVELRVDTHPIEYWNLGQESQKDWGINQDSGMGSTDILIGTKFNLIEETENHPAASLTILTRTATSTTEYRRGFDSAGYGFLITGGKRWIVDPDNFLCIERMGLDGGIGFLAVDANRDPTGVKQSGQNDFVWAALKLSCYSEKSVLSAGLRSEVGWFGEGDRLVEMTCGYTRAWNNSVSWYVEATCGLTQDAPDFTASTGILLHFKSPWRRK